MGKVQKVKERVATLIDNHLTDDSFGGGFYLECLLCAWLNTES